MDVTVTDVDETPELTGETAVDYNEGARDNVKEFMGDDPEGADVACVLSDDDAGAFSNEAGVLSFSTTTDYESPSDTDGDNVYSVTVSASYGNSTSSLDVTVSVIDVNERPVLSGPATVDIEEGKSGQVTSYSATEPEGDDIARTLRGVDAGRFSIEGGLLSFATSTDYETPTDSDADNVYSVNMEASDDNGTSLLEVLVAVTDVDIRWSCGDQRISTSRRMPAVPLSPIRQGTPRAATGSGAWAATMRRRSRSTAGVLGS